MKKYRKYIVCLALPFLLSSPVYADPTENETSASETEDSQEGTENETDATGETDGTEDTEEITEGPKEPEQIHGEIYNAETEVFLTNGTSRAKAVEESIESLNTGSPEELIRSVRYRYNALSMAEKAHVTNEDHLYEVEKNYGRDNATGQSTPITYDYQELYKDQQAPDAGRTTSHAFTISESRQQLSVSVKYTQDNDLDKVMDVPMIWLKHPDGNITELKQSDTEIRESEFRIKLSWTEGLMQIDVDNAVYGTWYVQTDSPVLFNELEYAGGGNTIQPDVPQGSTEDTTEYRQNQETPTKTSIWLKIILFAVGSAAFLIIVKLLLNKKFGTVEKGNQGNRGNKSKDNTQANRQSARSMPEDDLDPNDLEAMKNELRKTIGFEEEPEQPQQQQQQEQTQTYQTDSQKLATMEIPLTPAAPDVADNSDVLYWDGTTGSEVHQNRTQSAQQTAFSQPGYTAPQPTQQQASNLSMDEDDDDFLNDF